MECINLETERLLLKPLTLLHLSKEYVNWLNDVEIYSYLETGGNYTIEKLREFLTDQEEKKILFWAIHLKNSGKHIGNIKIDPLNETRDSGEYGIMMGDKTEWGKGYAREASAAVIKFCFKELGLSQITLGVIEKNTTAVKLYEKLGFKVDKVIMDFGVYQNQTCNSIRMIKKND